MKRMILFVTIVALFTLTTGATSSTYVYPEKASVFSITFPDEWQVESEEALLHASPADESIYFGVWALMEADSLDAALKALDESLADYLTELELGDPEEVEINEITFLTVNGQGKIPEGDLVNVSVALFSPEEKTVFIALYFGTPEAEEKHEETLTKVIQSIKKASNADTDEAEKDDPDENDEENESDEDNEIDENDDPDE